MAEGGSHFLDDQPESKQAPWVSAPPDPARQVYRLKPKPFERVNAAPAQQSADLGADPGVLPSAAGPIDVHDLIREAVRTPSAASEGKATLDTTNEIHALLRENVRHAEAAGLHALPRPGRRRSRRRRDYVLAMIFGNLVLAGCTLVAPVFGVAGLIIYNVGLTWVVWAVMDDY